MRSEQPVSQPEPAGGTFTSAARRAQFVSAAIDVIADVGYAQASLGRIAERVGVSKGVISYHFAGKSELVREVIADVAARGGAFIRAREAPDSDAPDRLRAWIESNLEFMAANRNALVAFHEIVLGARGEAAIGAAVASIVTAGAGALRELLAAGQGSGEFRTDFDPQAVAIAIRAAIDAVPPRMARDPGFDAARYGREIAGLFDIATRGAAPREPAVPPPEGTDHERI
jgi:AcrR family transcriptional regulator